MFRTMNFSPEILCSESSGIPLIFEDVTLRKENIALALSYIDIPKLIGLSVENGCVVGLLPSSKGCPSLSHVARKLLRGMQPQQGLHILKRCDARMKHA